MLLRKLWRDLWDQKGAYAACIIVIAIGLMVYSSMSMVMDTLLFSKNSFYKNQNFADGFAEVQGMPHNQVAALSQLEGIDQVQGRLVRDVRVLALDSEENVYLRLVSVDTSQAVHLNSVLLTEGIPLETQSLNMWVDNKFYEANNLQLNDEIYIIAEGKRQTFRIAGTGMNPEFTYALRNATDLYPNPKTFGIGYVPLEVMGSLFQQKSTVNSIVFTLSPGYQFDDVKHLVEIELKPYGLKSLYARADQISHVLLTQELDQLEGMAKTMPLIFLSVAAMILYIMLKRMIEMQRTQLGTLKAFGYTNREILWHYLSYVLITGLSGGLLGVLMGYAITGPFLSMYREFFNMPGLDPQFSVRYLFLSLVLATVFSLLAGYQGCKASLTLEPAEAMRPAAPPIGKNILLEKITIFWSMLTVQGKMALRSMLRNKLRTLFVFIGIMFTFSLLALPWTFKVIVDEMLFDQFEKVETYDIKLPLARPLPQEQVERELANFPGVVQVEGMAEVPVTLHNAWRDRGVLLLGLKQDSTLYNVLDSDGRRVTVPRDGIVISQRLADHLQAEAGSVLTVTSPLFSNSDERKALQVVAVIPQNLGMNAYMEISALQEFIGQGRFATSLMLSMNEENIAELIDQYNDSMMINSIENRLSLFRQLREMIASYMGMIYGMLIFGAVIGFAIIYNTSVITLSERSRELASMMVLGMTPQEVQEVITFEQWFVSIFAMLAGIPLTKGFLIAMASTVDNDMFDLAPILTQEALIAGFFFTVGSIFFAQKMAARKLRKLSLVEVLKSRE